MNQNLVTETLMCLSKYVSSNRYLKFIDCEKEKALISPLFHGDGEKKEWPRRFVFGTENLLVV